MKKYIFILFTFFFSGLSVGMDVLGGFISWKGNGTGRYIFELTLYRDCNGLDLSSNSEIITVWNHPTVTQLTVNLVERINITPTCTQVQGSLPPLSCGSGDNGGTGLGAIEKIRYESDPFDLDGKPPVEGWSFTFETLSRKASISNLSNPSQYGMTLSATLFENSPVQTNCMDASPRVWNDLNFIACKSDVYNFVQLISDEDLDQLKFSFSTPLKNNTSGAFQTGINPPGVDYLSGFSASLPVPGTDVSPSNQNISIDPATGDISFMTSSGGEYVMKFVVDSYRNGKRNASFDVELTVFVVDCDNVNTSPDVAGPFSGLFEYEAVAGEIINFTIASSDVELLQNGDFQKNELTPSGSMFGTNFSNPSGGCAIQPCATLSPLPLIPGIQGTSVDFSWQTSCNHLKNQYGNEFDSVAFDFVFKFQDNFCQVPKTTYKRVRIHIETETEIEPAQIDCIQVLQTGELMITRTDPANPNALPVSYDLQHIQTGALTPMPTSTLTLPATGSIEDFVVKTTSGNPCSISQVSDTVRNIVLTITPNPDNSVAILSWNSPYLSSEDRDGYYSIMREFPVGVWTEITQVDYGTNRYNDTVDICNAFLSYGLIYNKIGCSFFSNIVGADLQDGFTPDLPQIYSVSIDPLTEKVVVTWNKNPKKDTYGYIIYMRDENDFSVEIDTVWGRSNTSEEYDLETELEALTFTVAAFDSCFTDLGTFYSTTGKCPEHTTVFLTNSYDICSRTVNLSWSPYIGWDGVKEYEVLARISGGNYELVGVTTETSFSIQTSILKNYDFVVKAKDSTLSYESYSNRSSRFTLSPTQPTYHYTRTVSVENNENLIKHFIENNTGVKDLILQRQSADGEFSDLVVLPITSYDMSYTDTDVSPENQNYSYRVILVDSCGNYSDTANISRTMLLQVEPDNLSMVNYLNWTAYRGFNGAILYYNLYRGFENQFSTYPFAQVPANQLFYYDTIYDQLNFNGEVCYYVEAVEAINIYHFSETSKSNKACSVFDPLVYIPNSFTPNDDEFNQFFKPELSLKEVTSYELTIMNRWGEVVFMSHSKDMAWDGTNSTTNQSCPQGSYLYILKVKNGENQELSKKGYVNLLR